MCWIDSAGGTTFDSAVGDSAVGSPSYSTNLCSKIYLVGNVLVLLAKFPFTASKYDSDFSKTVVIKFSVTCSVLKYVSASSFGC